MDANVLARYFLRDDDVQLPIARRLMTSLTIERPGMVSHVTLVELDWLLGRGYKISKEMRLAAVRALVEAEEIEFEDGEGVVRALTLAEEGADFADALIATTMEQFGVGEIVTFDRAAADRLGWRLPA
nr:type II toxin-antitoxin system VapC family toxin [Microbacterium bovistercoris]